MTHLKKVTNPNWTCTPSDDLKVKASQNWSRWHLKTQLSQDVQTRPIHLFLTIYFYFFCGKKMPLSTFPKPPWKGGNHFFWWWPFENSLITNLWQINLSPAFSEGWEVSAFTSLFFPFGLLTDSGILSSFMAWICNLTCCVIGLHLVPNNSFEIPILFWVLLLLQKVH